MFSSELFIIAKNWEQPKYQQQMHGRICYMIRSRAIWNEGCKNGVVTQTFMSSLKRQSNFTLQPYKIRRTDID